MSDYEGRTVCGWCSRVISEATKPGLLDSHGICDECSDKLDIDDRLWSATPLPKRPA